MRLLILGTGRMAGTHAEAFDKIDGVTLVGCVDIRLDAAKAFAKTHDIPNAYENLAAAAQDVDFDAIANCTPDMVHFKTTMDALEAGFHVFCEKPLATNFDDATCMAETAERLGLVHGVNLTYRNVAALQKAREIVETGRIGAIRHFEASYLQSWLTQSAWGDWHSDPAWLWRLSSKHGSLGVLGDVGIHIFDFATFASATRVAEVTGQLATFSKAPGDEIDGYILDANDSFSSTVTLNSGATGVVHASRFASGHLNDLSLHLYGDAGGLKVTNKGPLGTLEICSDGDLETATWRAVPLAPVRTNFERFAEAVRRKQPMEPDFNTGAALQAVLDGVFEADAKGMKISLQYAEI